LYFSFDISFSGGARLFTHFQNSVTFRLMSRPRAIAVVDVGYTNAKLVLFSPDLEILAERKIASPHRKGLHYGEIDVEPVLRFLEHALPELDAMAPIDRIVTTAHGACIVAADAQGKPAVPVMDYMSEPPPDIRQAYAERAPSYAETYSPQLPVALLHAMQLFWQQRALPGQFERAAAILPLMQYVAMRLGGRPVTEISSMGCQSHLLDMNTLGPSNLAIKQGWAAKFAPRANAWEVIGRLSPQFRGDGFRGEGAILAGIHDSNANYLRYLAGGIAAFTLLSTGTWIIGFDTAANIASLDPERDIVANADIFGRLVACCRFFGGKEFEIVSAGAGGSQATLTAAQSLVERGVMALPTFTDSGGPMPGTGKKGRIIGEVTSAVGRASLASLYCALMVSESLDAVRSSSDIIVDGPFSQNPVFLSILASLRPSQKVKASSLQEGTAAGAACLALMPDGQLPQIDIDMSDSGPAAFSLSNYQRIWRKEALNA
jgi:sugar (pentulose or hexulose) kinase